MAQLAIQEASLSGLSPNYEAASAGGDTFKTAGRVYLHAKNGDASAHTVTVNSVRACDQGFDHDASVSVPAGEERIIGPFPAHRFGVEASISYPAGVTSLSVAAVKVSD